MDAALDEFESRMHAVMAQAATFDAERITTAQSAVAQWFAQLQPNSLTAEQLQQVRQRLHAYCELCCFLQATLNDALVSAGHIQGAGYSGRGAPGKKSQPLMRRYG